MLFAPSAANIVLCGASCNVLIMSGYPKTRKVGSCEMRPAGCSAHARFSRTCCMCVCDYTTSCYPAETFQPWNLLAFPWHLNSTKCETTTPRYIQIQPVSKHMLIYIYITSFDQLESTQNPGNLARVVCPPASYCLERAGPCLEPAVSKLPLLRHGRCNGWVPG